jgi:hypothetical protein
LQDESDVRDQARVGSLAGRRSFIIAALSKSTGIAPSEQVLCAGLK